MPMCSRCAGLWLGASISAALAWPVLPLRALRIVLPQGDALVGRGGADNLKTGQANASVNFIRLDLTGSEATPGTFFGRFQDSPDLIGVQFTDKDSQGHRQVSILVCDGRPAPVGRTEWFSGEFVGDFPVCVAIGKECEDLHFPRGQHIQFPGLWLCLRTADIRGNDQVCECRIDILFALLGCPDCLPAMRSC